MVKAAFLALVFTMAACTYGTGTRFDWQEANRVTNGLTREQVISIMGSKPDMVGDDYISWNWFWVNSLTGSYETKNVKFSFDKNGKTIGVPDGGVGRNIVKYVDD